MMGIESDIARSSNSRVIDFDTVIRKCLIKQEQILNKVNSPVKPSLKNELLMCGWVKVVPRVARWLSPKYRTLIVPMSVAQNIKLLTHALSGKPRRGRKKIWWLYGECFIGLGDGRPWVLLSVLKWTKIPDSPVQYWTPGNSTCASIGSLN